MLTGAVLAKFLPWPVAILLAFASHFALDAAPHFGFQTLEKRRQQLRLFLVVNTLDFALTVILALWLLRQHHLVWLLFGFIAYSPDLLWIYRFVFEEKFGRRLPTNGNAFMRFHKRIQRYERKWGILVEAVYGSLIFLALH